MFAINEYSVVTRTLSTVVLFSSSMMEKLEACGCADTGLLKVSSALESELTDEVRAEAQAHLMNIIAMGLTVNGVRYVPFFAGSSDIRKGSSVWINADLYAEIGKWAMCGLKTSELNIAVNKYAAYIGLLMSSTRPFQQVYGTRLNVRRVCVVPDTYVTVSGTVDFVEGTTVTRKEGHTVSVNAFDGAAYIRPEITGGKCSTLRAPWVKALAVPIDFIGYAEEHGLSTVIKDYWGNEVDLREIDLILTESCFKMAGQYKSFQRYQEAFEAAGHEFRVCVEEHPARPKAMPYQQLQTLVGGTWEDAMKLAYMTREVMIQYRDPDQAAKLAGHALGKAARLCHGLLAEPYTKGLISDAYASKRTRAIGGKVLGIGANAFVAPDPVAMLEALYGLPIKGVLKAGEVHCKPAGFGVVDVTRSPHFGHEHAVLWNVSQPSKYMMGPTMYFNIWDMTTIRLRADYDGDHVWYSRNSFLLEAVRKTDKLLGNLPVDWVAPKAPKAPINRANLAQFFGGLTQTSQIGIYADNFTRFWAWLTTELDKETITTEEAREVWCWLTYAGNVLIDAAKHGSANVRPPKRVREFSHMPLPAFCEYAKASATHPVGDEYWAGRCSKTEGFGDMYSRAVRNNVDEELHIDGVEDLVFDPTMLMWDPDARSIGNLKGLFVRGRWNRETQTSEGEGLFQRLAFLSARELEALKTSNADAHALESWEQERGRIAYQQIVSWVEERGESIEHAYDLVVKGVFCGSNNASEGYRAVMKRAFWSIFGEMAVEAIQNNLYADVFDTELELPDIDLDSDDCDDCE